jgi:hypothetical protein
LPICRCAASAALAAGLLSAEVAAEPARAAGLRLAQRCAANVASADRPAAPASPTVSIVRPGEAG